MLRLQTRRAWTAGPETNSRVSVVRCSYTSRMAAVACQSTCCLQPTCQHLKHLSNCSVTTTVSPLHHLAPRQHSDAVSEGWGTYSTSPQGFVKRCLSGLYSAHSLEKIHAMMITKVENEWDTDQRLSHPGQVQSSWTIAFICLFKRLPICRQQALHTHWVAFKWVILEIMRTFLDILIDYSCRKCLSPNAFA